MGIIIHHYKGRYQTSSTMESKSFFRSDTRWFENTNYDSACFPSFFGKTMNSILFQDGSNRWIPLILTRCFKILNEQVGYR